MADLPNRDELEAQLAKKLGKIMQRQLGHLMEELGDPPDINNLSPEFWEGVSAETAAAIAPELEAIFLQQAQALLEAQPIGVDWALVNEGAANWALAHVPEMVQGMEATTQRAVQQKLAAFFTEQQTLGELKQSLASVLGPVRADLVAATEITRAAVEGELAIVEEIAREGVRMVPIWQTSNDERVCPICEPKNEQVITDGEYPPAHTRCRCWVNHEFPRD